MVTLVTVLYNSSHRLAGLVASARSSAAGVPLRIIAVDNASADQRHSRAQADSLGITVLPLPTNLGYGTGINAGVRYAKEHSLLDEVILITNPDLEFTGTAIRTLAEAAATEPPEVAAWGPRILRPDGTVYPSARRLPRLGMGIGHALLSQIPNPWTHRYHAADAASDTARSAEWLSGACILMRADWFARVGGFDERYFMYFEDVDLGRRIGNQGGTVRYTPSAEVIHVGRESTSGRRDDMIRAHHDSAMRYLTTSYPRWWQWPLRVAIRLGLATRRELLIARGRARPQQEHR